MNLLGCKKEDIIGVSAKTGLNVEKVLDAIIEKCPSPKRDSVIGSALNNKEIFPRETTTSADLNARKSALKVRPDVVVSNGRKISRSEQSLSPIPLRALIFDSYFDDYRGVVLYVRIMDGELPKNANIKMMATDTNGIALEVGKLKPAMQPQDKLSEGEIGYIVTNLKTTREAKVGDTVTLAKNPAKTPLPGYKNVLPFVYAGFFPVSNDQYKDLKEAIEKLALSDSALQYEPENSPVLGFGLRIGFLGLLHMDIIKERLEREFKLDLVVTNPSTNYEVTLADGSNIEIKSAADLPDQSQILEIREPWVKGEIIVPKSMIGNVLNLIVEKRGRQTNLSYIEDRAVIDFEAPMANLLTDFYDQLKSTTSGYASFNYELSDYRAEDLVRVDFLVAGQKIDALAIMCHRQEADSIGREVTKKLKEVIPRQSFEVALQAAIGARIIARETIGAYRKDVLVKIHTGDRDRKAKLLEKQKRGKARMKRFGKVDIPSEAFTVMLKRD
ncbi:translation elongation factor 4 [Candidatus Saccharibacteria bacterium]|nr:translation elongation factor 4 [Candidatus Saccharibacteria bacterium]